MKKIEERMKKVNGKPYLRTKIALRVIVWWPFCDFFKKNLIPALVKVTIGQKRKRKDMREKVENSFIWQRRTSIDVTFPKEKVHIFFLDATVAVTVLRWGATRKDLTATAIFKKLYGLPQRGDTFVADDTKIEKKRKIWKKSKKVSKGASGGHLSPKYRKQSIW